MEFDNGYERGVAGGPEEFVEVLGEHLHMMLFGRNDDVLDVLADGDERAGLDVVEASVLDDRTLYS